MCRIALVLCLMATAGCETVKMAVPEGLAEVSEELPISGRGGSTVKMGPYEITDIDRDVDVHLGGSVPGFAHAHTSGGYSYLLRGSGGERTGQCAVTGDKVGIAGLGATWGTLGCACQGSRSESSFKLPLGDGWQLRHGSMNRGELQVGGRALAVQVIAAVETGGRTYDFDEGRWKKGGSMPWKEPTGCHVDDAAGPVAGLELLPPGRIWLARSLESTERADMACLLSGILLYQP